MRPQHPDIVVPDLQPSPMTAIERDGKVTCVTCLQRLPLAEADVVGLGYSCRKCTVAAEVAGLERGEVDPSQNLTASDQAKLPKLFTGAQLLLLGGALLALAVLFWIAGIETPTYRGMPLPLWVGIGGVGAIAVGLTRVRFRLRKLVIPRD